MNRSECVRVYLTTREVELLDQLRGRASRSSFLASAMHCADTERARHMERIAFQAMSIREEEQDLAEGIDNGEGSDGIRAQKAALDTMLRAWQASEQAVKVAAPRFARFSLPSLIANIKAPTSPTTPMPLSYSHADRAEIRCLRTALSRISGELADAGNIPTGDHMTGEGMPEAIRALVAERDNLRGGKS